MQLKGKLIKLLPLQSGEGKSGFWKKQEFIVETKDEYPKKICFTLWGDKVRLVENFEGQDVTVSFDLESREYNGRWFTEAKAWKIERNIDEADSSANLENYDWLDAQQSEESSENELPF